MNDFLEYNLTKAEIEKRRQAKVKAGRKGGLISSESKQETESIPDAQADAQAKFNPITHNPFPLPDNPKDTTTGTTFFRRCKSL